MSYRARLFEKLKEAQSNYENKVANSPNDFKLLQQLSEQPSPNPLKSEIRAYQPIVSNELRFHKTSKTCCSVNLQRYFEVDGKYIKYKQYLQDASYKKAIKMEGTAKIEEYEPGMTWHEPIYKYRIALYLKERDRKRPLYHYWNDLDYLKKLQITVKPRQMAIDLRPISELHDTLYIVRGFEAIRQYEPPVVKKIIKEEKPLVAVAPPKPRVEKPRRVVATSKFIRSVYQIQGFLAFKSKYRPIEEKAKYQRNLNLQQQGSTCLYIRYEADDFTFEADDSQGRLHLDSDTLTIENLESDLSEKKVICGQLSQRIALRDVSMISKKHNKVTVYGRVKPYQQRLIDTSLSNKGLQRPVLLTQQSSKNTDTNLPVELLGLSPLSCSSDNRMIVGIESIVLPTSFVKEWNKRAFIRIKCVSGDALPIYTPEFSLLFTGVELHKRLESLMEIKTPGYSLCMNQSQNTRFSLELTPCDVPLQAAIKRMSLLPPIEDKFYSDQLELMYKDTKIDLNGAQLNIRVQKSTDDGITSEPFGPRLLVGGPVLYRGSKATLTQVDKKEDGTFLVHLGHQKAPLHEVTPVSMHGVSQYDNSPAQLAKWQYQWSLNFETNDESLLPRIHSAIRLAQAKPCPGVLSKEDQPLSGNVVVAIEGLQLRQQVGNRQQVLVSQLGSLERKSLELEIGSNPIMNKKDSPKIMRPPLFSQIKCGWVTSETDIDAPEEILFEVRGIGFASIPVAKILQKEEMLVRHVLIIQKQRNENKGSLLASPSKDPEVSLDMNQSVIVKTMKDWVEAGYDGKEEIHGILIVKVAFFADHVTQLRHEMLHNYPILRENIAALEHFEMLTRKSQRDAYGFKVPLNEYRPNKKNSNDLKQAEYFSGNFEQKLEQLGKSKGGLKFSIKNKMLMSKQEFLDLGTSLQGDYNPQMQEYSSQLHRMCGAQSDDTHLQVAVCYQTSAWFNYFHQLWTKDDVRPLFTTADIKQTEQQLLSDHNSSFVGEVIDRLYQRTKQLQKEHKINFREIEADDPDASFQAQEIKLHNMRVDNLVFAGKWQEEKTKSFQGIDNANYKKWKDLYYLVYDGIPDRFRIHVWKEFLKVKVVEFEECQAFRKLYAYQKQFTVYQNYKIQCDKHDCLGFRQIDEDIASFKFPENLQSETKRSLTTQKLAMRNILRVLTMWSKTRTITILDEQETKGMKKRDVCFSYGKGLLFMIVRVLQLPLCEEEDCFWVISGLVRSYARPFSVENSILLEEDSKSMMRYEIIAFKSLMQSRMPKVLPKLQEIGLPLELLIYDALNSYYADYFPSELLMRIWDIMLFQFSGIDKSLRKIGTWYILAPAFVILQRQQEEILKAKTFDEAWEAFHMGKSSGFFEYKTFGKNLEQICSDLFVTGEQQTSIFQNVMTVFGVTQASKGLNQAAIDFDELRTQRQGDVQKVFKNVHAENREVDSLVKNCAPREGYEKLTYEALRKLMMSNIAQKSNRRNSHLHQSTQMLLKQRSALESDSDEEYHKPLDKIHIYVHEFTQMNEALSRDGFRVQVSYGGQVDGVFKEKEIGKNQTDGVSPVLYKVFKDPKEPIRLYNLFKYHQRCDFIKIKVTSARNQQISAQIVIPLNMVPQDYITMENMLLQEDSLTQTKVNVSLFAESTVTHTPSVSGSELDKKQDHIPALMSTIRKKPPSKIDVFHHQSTKDPLHQAFDALVNQEFTFLRQVLVSESRALDFINESFNHFEHANYGNLSEVQFKSLCAQILPGQLAKCDIQIQAIYNKFVGKEPGMHEGTEAKENHKSHTESKSWSMKASMALISDSFSPNVHQKLYLRQFLVTFVLMSHSTIHEKLDILYDLFDWSQGSHNGLRCYTMIEVVKTICERSLYHCPDFELYNTLEYVLSGSAPPQVHKALWTSRTARLEAEGFEDEEAGYHADVTKIVQIAFMRYFQVFGTKVIDFNPDISAYGKLEWLVGTKVAQDLLRQSANSKEKWSLILFYTKAGKKYTFTILYDNKSGVLLDAGPSSKSLGQKNLHPQTTKNIDKIIDYFERNSRKLYLVGSLNRTIGKDEFIEKMSQFGVVSNILRVETFWRDRGEKQENGSKDPLKAINFVPTKSVKLNFMVLFPLGKFTLLFNFRMGMIKDYKKEGSEIQRNNNIIQVTMKELKEETIFCELKERIQAAVGTICERNQDLKKEFPADWLHTLTRRKFKAISEKSSAMVWKEVKDDFSRLSALTEREQISGKQILLKLDESKGSSAIHSLSSVASTPEVPDCWSIYRHQDRSYEWLPARIVNRKLKNCYKGANQYMYTLQFLKQDTFHDDAFFERQDKYIVFGRDFTMRGTNFVSDSLEFAIRVTTTTTKDI